MERSIRANNVVLFNIVEKDGVSDVEKVNDALAIIDPSLVALPENIFRIGKKDGSKCRPIRVRFKYPEQARLCLRKKSSLMASDEFSRVAIQDDKTPSQLNFLQELRNDLKTRLDSGETNLTIKYKNRVPQIVTSQKN